MVSSARLPVGSEPQPPSRARHKDSPQLERGSRHRSGKHRKSTRWDNSEALLFFSPLWVFGQYSVWSLDLAHSRGLL